jgi:hypothetical protein
MIETGLKQEFRLYIFFILPPRHLKRRVVYALNAYEIESRSVDDQFI